MASLRQALPLLGAAHDCFEPRCSPDVLIVGGGLTGALTAAFLHRMRPTLQLQVWDRATYPSGRFGAGLRVGQQWANLGAQVLSVVRLDSGHPNAGVDGHNVRAADIQAAWVEVQTLVADGTLILAGYDDLGDTEERMKYDGLWSHYWCPSGFGPGVLQRYLAESRADVLLRTRADAIEVETPEAVAAVTGVTPRGSLQAMPRALVLAVPAPEAVSLLPSCAYARTANLEMLKHVGYDSRIAVALAFDPVIFLSVADYFGAAAELTLDLGEPGKSVEGTLHLLTWQGARASAGVAREPVLIVAHSVVGAGVEETVAAALAKLAEELSMTVPALESLILERKVVDWTVCQMTLPMEALMSSACDESCLEAGRIIVAGDFCTQSSFLGCYCSAAAAARAVIRRLDSE